MLDNMTRCWRPLAPGHVDPAPSASCATTRTRWPVTMAGLVTRLWISMLRNAHSPGPMVTRDNDNCSANK
eukprot:9230632-Pyramimonas_sp.AAC.1